MRPDRFREILKRVLQEQSGDLTVVDATGTQPTFPGK